MESDARIRRGEAEKTEARWRIKQARMELMKIRGDVRYDSSPQGLMVVDEAEHCLEELNLI